MRERKREKKREKRKREIEREKVIERCKVRKRERERQKNGEKKGVVRFIGWNRDRDRERQIKRWREIERESKAERERCDEISWLIDWMILTACQPGILFFHAFSTWVAEVQNAQFSCSEFESYIFSTNSGFQLVQDSLGQREGQQTVVLKVRGLPSWAGVLLLSSSISLNYGLLDWVKAKGHIHRHKL